MTALQHALSEQIVVLAAVCFPNMAVQSVRLCYHVTLEAPHTPAPFHSLIPCRNHPEANHQHLVLSFHFKMQEIQYFCDIMIQCFILFIYFFFKFCSLQQTAAAAARNKVIKGCKQSFSLQLPIIAEDNQFFFFGSFGPVCKCFPNTCVTFTPTSRAHIQIDCHQCCVRH